MLVKPIASPMRPAVLNLIFCLTTSGIIATSGCASRDQPKPKPQTATVPSSRVVGEIAVVDEEKRFVLIDLESNLYVPPPGLALRAIGAAGETARLKASPEQKRPFVAADIVEGDPAVGDQVVR